MLRLVLIALLAMSATSIKAETWPNRPLTMVVPFATGGPMGMGTGRGDPQLVPAGHTDLILSALG